MPDYEQPDLGALLADGARVIARRETPILERHGISMWEYVVLARLDGAGPVSQATLSTLTRRDPTRLVRHLDELQARGLVTREVDGGDRRRHLVALSASGRATLRACRRDIRTMEDELLGMLSRARRDHLRADLAALLDGERGS